jgi:hypothetical protein
MATSLEPGFVVQHVLVPLHSGQEGTKRGIDTSTSDSEELFHMNNLKITYCTLP